MIILKIYLEEKISDVLVQNSIIKPNQSVFNNIDDKAFFNFIYFKIEDSLPTDLDEGFDSDLNEKDYLNLFNQFDLNEDELISQNNDIEAYTFDEKFYAKDLNSDKLEEIESEASIGAVECFPKFTKKGVLWDVSSEDWPEDEYRVFSGVTLSQLQDDLDLNQILELLVLEEINDIKNLEDFNEWYPSWHEDRDDAIEEIWSELKRRNSYETRLGFLNAIELIKNQKNLAENGSEAVIDKTQIDEALSKYPEDMRLAAKDLNLEYESLKERVFADFYLKIKWSPELKEPSDISDFENVNKIKSIVVECIENEESFTDWSDIFAEKGYDVEPYNSRTAILKIKFDNCTFNVALKHKVKDKADFIVERFAGWSDN